MPDELLTLFNFEVRLTPSGRFGDGEVASTAAFSEVSGLEINVEKKELHEGGYHYGSRQLIGKTTHPVLVLKRGLSLDEGFWTWIQSCVDGFYPLPYVSGSVLSYPSDPPRTDERAAVWNFVNGIVIKVKASDLNAGSASQVPIEELHIAHEGLLRSQWI